MFRIDPAIRLPLFLALLMVAIFVIVHAWENRKAAPREYANECSICHHGGHGQASEIAPIFGRVGRIAATPAGHHYIIDVLLYGLAGTIHANGERYNDSMPSFNKLPDAEIAEILTYVAAQETTGPAPAFTAAEVKAVRAHPLTPPEVLQERRQLDQNTPLP